jgi:muconate cycloisomerase
MTTVVPIRNTRVMLVDVPTIRPHVLAMATMSKQTIVLVEIEREDGVRGYGEATTIGGLAYGEESPESIKVAVETYFKPLIQNCDANRPASVMALLNRQIVGNRFAKCAVETALFDAMGRASNLPVSELLGGRQRDVLPVAWTLASGHTAKDIDEAEQMLAAKRHNVFKIKIGKRDIVKDCDHVAAIAKALGDRASIRVDVNQHWTRAHAMQGIARLQYAGVSLIEQPIAATDVVGMHQLCNRFDLAIMADEALTGPSSAARYIEALACDVISLKINQSGGLTEARKVAALAEVAHVALYGGTMLEGGIGTAAAAHLFSTLPAMEWGTELFGPLLLTEELLVEPLVYRDFGLVVPSGPGLGVVIDQEKIAHFERK